MNPQNPTSLRRAAAALAAVLVVGGLALAQPARAVTPTETARLAGADRYETAVAVAEHTFPRGAADVILATGEDFADALASSGMAGALDAPILLTLSDRLLDVTEQGLADLQAETVHLMGGTAALSTTVEDQLIAAGYEVERVFGDTRYGTAVAAAGVIADQAAPVTGEGGIGSTSNGTTAILTNGLKFPDAVSASPVAYAGNLPILLTAKDVIPQVTLGAIEDLGIEHVVLVGGTGVISATVRQQVENDTGVTTQRLAGAARWDTNVEVVQFGVDEVELGGQSVHLSTGVNFADALVGGPAAGQTLGRLLLVHPDEVPAPTQTYIEANAGNIDVLIAIGGPAAVPAEVLSSAAAAAKQASNQVYDVSPETAEGLEQSSGATDNTGRRTYTVTGLASGTTYDIAILDAAVVSGQGTGNVRIESFTLAQGGSTAIETVNGSSFSSGGPAGSNTEVAHVEGDAQGNGELTFSIDSTEQDSVIPVVFLDEDGDDELALAGDVPDEPFGIGGETQWMPPEAADGEANGVTVTSANTASNAFVADGATYHYSSFDLFRYAGDPVTHDEFEAMITAGDVLDIDYLQEGQSRFDVTDDELPDIGTPVASLPDQDNLSQVQVSWTGSAQPDAVYRVYRDTDLDGSFDPANDPQVYPEAGTSTSDTTVTFDEGTELEEERQYIVVPLGGTSGDADDRDDDGDPVTFVSNEIVLNAEFRGLNEDGTAVSFNSGLDQVTVDDQWQLHFSKPVSIQTGATVTVTDAGGDTATFTRGTDSTWEANGSTVTITLTSVGSTVPDIEYASDTDVAVDGVVDAATGDAPSNADALDGLEDDGPELMLGSSTCDPGDTQCTLAFNEPVDQASAENRLNWAYVGDSTLSSIALADDARTVTLVFSGGIGEGDQVSPFGVEDDDGQTSGQGLFDFVT